MSDAASTTERPLVDQFHDWVTATVSADGFDVPHALVVTAEGALAVYALAVPPEQAYRVMIGAMVDGASEAVFALDRFTKPGQGTTLGDVLAGFHLRRRADPRPFIIEYQHEPRVVKPIEWGNAWWNAALTRELLGHVRAYVGATTPVRH